MIPSNSSKSKAFSPSKPAPAKSAPAKSTTKSSPAPSHSSGAPTSSHSSSSPHPTASSFRPAAARAVPVRIDGGSPPATTLHSERLGDGQANCLERAYGLAGCRDTVLLCSDRNDSSGHAVVQHNDGSVTDPNQPTIRYPDLGSWQATHPQYEVVARVSQPQLEDVLSLPPGAQREAEIDRLGLGDAAQVSVADEEYRALNTPLNLRSEPDPNSEALLDAPMPEGSVLQVLEHGDEDHAGWARVQYQDPAGTQHEGWAMIDGTNDDGTAYSREIPASDVEQIQQAEGLYINQFYADDNVVDRDRANANCGPTSLAVAFDNQGLALPEVNGLLNDGSQGDRVYRARFAMYGEYPAAEGSEQLPNSSLDGVEDEDGDGSYTYATGTEASQLTGLEHMERAVDAAGGYSQRIDASSDAIRTELEAGRTVIVAGTFDTAVTEQNPDGRKDGLWDVDDSVHAHIVAVTGVTSDGSFIVSDPANPDRRPVVVTAAQLDSFIEGNAAQPVSIGGADDPALQGS